LFKSLSAFSVGSDESKVLILKYLYTPVFVNIKPVYRSLPIEIVHEESGYERALAVNFQKLVVAHGEFTCQLGHVYKFACQCDKKYIIMDNGLHVRDLSVKSLRVLPLSLSLIFCYLLSTRRLRDFDIHLSL
jgi:hypothetical protein